MTDLPALDALTAWFGQHLPEVVADLNPPVTSEALADLEEVIGTELPAEVRALYQWHDGQRGQAQGLFFGQQFLPVSQVKEQWQMWRDLLQGDPQLMADLTQVVWPPQAIRAVYFDPGWIPFSADGLGGHFATDLNPETGGRRGQIINYGKYASKKVVLAANMHEFLEWMAGQLQAGKGRVYESAGMRLFDHADWGDINLEDGLEKTFGHQE